MSKRPEAREERGEGPGGKDQGREARDGKKKPYRPPELTAFGPVEEHTGPDGIVSR